MDSWKIRHARVAALPRIRYVQRVGTTGNMSAKDVKASFLCRLVEEEKHDEEKNKGMASKIQGCK